MMRVFTVMRRVMLGAVVGIAGLFLVFYLFEQDPALLAAAGATAFVTLLMFIVMDRALAATLRPRLK